MISSGQFLRTNTSLSVSDIPRHWTHDDLPVPAVVAHHTATDLGSVTAALGRRGVVTTGLQKCGF